MKKATTVILFFVAITACHKGKMHQPVSKEFLHPTNGFSKAVTVADKGFKTIYISGLTGDGEDFKSQTIATFNNIKTELETAGATFKDVVKMNTYIVDYKPEFIDIFRSVRKEILGEVNMPASTVVGVQALAAKGKMIEIEAIAVVKIH